MKLLKQIINKAKITVYSQVQRNEEENIEIFRNINTQNEISDFDWHSVFLKIQNGNLKLGLGLMCSLSETDN